MLDINNVRRNNKTTGETQFTDKTLKYLPKWIKIDSVDDDDDDEQKKFIREESTVATVPEVGNLSFWPFYVPFVVSN